MVGASQRGLTVAFAALGGGVYTALLRVRDFGTVISWLDNRRPPAASELLAP